MTKPTSTLPDSPTFVTAELLCEMAPTPQVAGTLTVPLRNNDSAAVGSSASMQGLKICPGSKMATARALTVAPPPVRNELNGSVPVADATTWTELSVQIGRAHV